MKNLLRQLKFERLISDFLSCISIETPIYDTAYDEVFYNYYEVIVVYIDDENKVIEIHIDDILRLLDIEYERYIYNRIVKFIDKQNYKKMIFSGLTGLVNVENYEKIITEVKT